LPGAKYACGSLENGVSVIQQQRVRVLREGPVARGRYVLYWMQAAQRAHYNHALEYAIDRANELGLPVVVFFGLTGRFPEANLRHYSFMLDGLRGTRDELARRGVATAVQHISPEIGAARMARDAALVVTDVAHLRIQRQWRVDVARDIACRFVEVETNLVVPVAEASAKEEFSAGTFRPRVTRQLARYLAPLRHRRLRKDSLGLRLDSIRLDDPTEALAALKLDTDVGPARGFAGGTSEAISRLKAFLRDKLPQFETRRNDPCADAVSHMSPYLHFGQISPLYIALQVRRKGGPGSEAYLEELIVRRELAHNFVWYNPHYDDYACLHEWSKKTLAEHRRDKREYLYTSRQFEQARTHDPYWNAAQKEMVLTGKMHGYMRMYWGKKILQWSESPREGFAVALYLNNKYELDGRDPNGFAGVAWCFGKHDRAWGGRPVFGKVRYMNAAGLRRKFDADAYVRQVQAIQTA